MKKVNIGLKEETHAQAKIISVLKKTTLQDYLQEAIETSVKKDRALLGRIRGEKEESIQ
jgi:hypothetical protein